MKEEHLYISGLLYDKIVSISFPAWFSKGGYLSRQQMVLLAAYSFG
jgi:hypothetical protein